LTLLTPKLTNYLDIMSTDEQREMNNHLITLVLTTLHILLENCGDFMNEFIDNTSNVIININILFRFC
jgi:hypothetical protein